MATSSTSPPTAKIKALLDNALPTLLDSGIRTFSWTGKGIGVVVLDSAVGDHPDLVRRIVFSQNFIGDKKPATDEYGHGTHVAGIIAGQGDIDNRFGGGAPRANILNLRVLDENGNGQDSAAILGILGAIELKNTHNVRVLNLSLGRPWWRVSPTILAVARWNRPGRRALWWS